MWKNSLILVSCKLFSNDKKMSKTLQDFTKMKKKNYNVTAYYTIISNKIIQ